MPEITITGQGLIKKIDKTEARYSTYIPDNGELVCVTDGDTAGLVVGDGVSVTSGCSQVNGYVVDPYTDDCTYENDFMTHVVEHNIVDFTKYDFVFITSKTSSYAMNENGDYVLSGIAYIDKENTTAEQCRLLCTTSIGTEYYTIGVATGFGWLERDAGENPGETMTDTIYFVKY